MSSEINKEEQINGLKKVGLNSLMVDTKKKVIDTLATYGEKAIPAITEIIDNSVMVEVREHGLDTIKKIKQK